ncbi:MAG: hypothetical protein Q8754_02805, partial [Sweet potato little leaf phytoplasma]|nr:hypothetical protein [Sweet potato little leaf phytoplasma]
SYMQNLKNIKIQLLKNKPTSNNLQILILSIWWRYMSSSSTFFFFEEEFIVNSLLTLEICLHCVSYHMKIIIII